MRWNLLLIALLSMGTSVIAQSVEPKKEDAEVVVTATRDERAIERAPYFADVMTTEELRVEQAFRTVPEALKRQTGTLIQKTGHAHGSPYIRGVTSFRNLFLIDGIRLNNSVFRQGPNQYWGTVDVQSLGKIEVVHGPFSVLYGSDALGGTINVFSERLDLRQGSQWDRKAYYRYSSAENSHVARLQSSSLIGDNVGLTVGYTYKDFGDLEGGKDVGTQEKTGYDEINWDARLELFLSDDSYLVLAHQSVDQDNAWRTHKTIYGIDWEGLSAGSELRRALWQDRKLSYLQYRAENMDGFADEIHAGIAHHMQEELRERDRSRSRFDEQGFTVDTSSAFVQLKSASGHGEYIYGAEYYHDDVDSFNNSLNADGSIKSSSIQGPVADDATYDLAGVYFQDHINASDRMTIMVGARYDYAAADADKVEDPNTGNQISISDSWDSLVGSGRVLYRLGEQDELNVFAGISQGFRAPNLSDLTRLDSARTDEIETPTPNLDPEEFISYEIGFKSRTDRFFGQLAFYHNVIDGMIVRTPTGRKIGDEFEVTKQNAGDGYTQGVELQCEYDVTEDINVFSSFTWFDGELETFPTSDPVLVKEPTDRYMPMTGRVGSRWQVTDSVWVEGICTVADKADTLSTRDKSDTSRIPPGGTPGYTVFDLRAGWTVNDDLKLSAAVENIGDEDYRVHGSGLNEPGRNLILAAEMVF